MEDPGYDTASKGRVVITHARSMQALAATRSLGRRGIEVVVADAYPMTMASFSRYAIGEFQYADPHADPQGFLDDLCTMVRRFKPAGETPYVLMPFLQETYLIAKHRARLEPHIRIPLPEYELIERVRDKGRLAEFAEAHALPTPQTWRPASLAELEAIVDRIPLPAFVKLRTGAAGVGVVKVEKREDLVPETRRLVETYELDAARFPIVQESVPGDDYCTTALMNKGRLVTTMTYRNLRTFPAGHGPGVLRETVEAPRLEEVAARLLTALGWHGIAEIDFRWDGMPGGAVHLIEVNPRFFGGLQQAIASGWDYAWMLFQLAATGEVEPPARTRTGVRTETPLLAVLATLEELSSDEGRFERLKEAWRQAQVAAQQDGWRAGAEAIWNGLGEFLDLKERHKRASALLEDHEDTLSNLFSSDDPLPVLGLLFPLAVFLRHGKVNADLLTGTPKGGRKS